MFEKELVNQEQSPPPIPQTSVPLEFSGVKVLAIDIAWVTGTISLVTILGFCVIYGIIHLCAALHQFSNY